RSRNKTRLVATEPGGSGSDFIDAGHAAQCIGLHSFGTQLFGIRRVRVKQIIHVGLDSAGAESVDSNPVPSVFKSGAFREAENGMLRSGIRRHIFFASEAEGGRYVNDRSATRFHHRLNLASHT